MDKPANKMTLHELRTIIPQILGVVDLRRYVRELLAKGLTGSERVLEAVVQSGRCPEARASAAFGLAMCHADLGASFLAEVATGKRTLNDFDNTSRAGLVVQPLLSLLLVQTLFAWAESARHLCKNGLARLDKSVGTPHARELLRPGTLPFSMSQLESLAVAGDQTESYERCYQVFGGGEEFESVSRTTSFGDVRQAARELLKESRPAPGHDHSTPPDGRRERRAESVTYLWELMGEIEREKERVENEERERTRLEDLRQREQKRLRREQEAEDRKSQEARERIAREHRGARLRQEHEKSELQRVQLESRRADADRRRIEAGEKAVRLERQQNEMERRGRNGLCINCGQRLTLISRILRRRRHSACDHFVPITGSR